MKSVRMPIRMKASEQCSSVALFIMYPAVRFLLQSNFCAAKFVETKIKKAFGKYFPLMLFRQLILWVFGSDVTLQWRLTLSSPIMSATIASDVTNIIEFPQPIMIVGA